MNKITQLSQKEEDVIEELEHETQQRSIRKLHFS